MHHIDVTRLCMNACVEPEAVELFHRDVLHHNKLYQPVTSIADCPDEHHDWPEMVAQYIIASDNLHREIT